MNAEQIRQVLVEELRNLAPESDPQAVADNDDLRDTLDIDSMDFLNLVIALHRRLGVDIPEVDYRKLQTLGSAVAYLSSRVPT
jgi:acyl carrier protein